ncbi:hypothetical protein [Amorphus orientalis]|uniref:Uncharacterized protein n=1 Tax=Amorphus orientalis TaxID=649198 RepID=A0AAE3VRD4_9HYPH|nr:hypothetical protein [Amorphus orientalis]MDQ0317349.1 hypothetical protein [Amorphus orientalis]
MATPKELVETVAAALNVTVNTVTVHDRYLHEAGLRTSGGRGRAAARVTYQDAANLLIAIAMSRNVKDSPETVRTYCELPSVGGRYLFADEKRGASFGDALAALLEAAGNDSMSYGYQDDLDVTLFGPTPGARIEWSKRGTQTQRDYGEVSYLDPIKYMARLDLTPIGEIGHKVGAP